MKPLAKPEAKLFCQDVSCGYSDECWRFKAFGGDDVVYKCPKCDSVADVVAPEASVEAVEKKEDKMDELYFIVADLEKHILRVMKEGKIIEEGMDDADICIPMIDPADMDQLNPRAKKDFYSSVSFLETCLEEGTLPYLRAVNIWLAKLNPSAPETDVDSVPDDLTNEEAFISTFMTDFKEGFKAGVEFAMRELKPFTETEKMHNTPSLPASKKGRKVLLAAMRRKRKALRR